MKNTILAAIFMFLDLILMIGGLTLFIVSFFIDDNIGQTLSFVGNYGIGAVIGSLLLFLTFYFLSKAID